MKYFQLRDYQQDLSDRYNTASLMHRCIMLQLSTGGGKTVIFSFLIKEALARGWKCLVLAHRIELILQAVDKTEAITDEPVGIIKAGYPTQYDRPIQIASVQSLVKRLNSCPQFDLIVIDEAHHATAATYKKIIDYFPAAQIIGATATPCRLDGKGFNSIFTELITGIDTKELMNRGALSKYKYYATAKTMSMIGVSKRKGDYVVADVEKANPISELAADIVKAYNDYSQGKQAVIFAVSVEYSIITAAHFNAAGIIAAHLDGDSKKEIREETIAAFRAGQIAVLCNYGLFDEGVDIPGIESVILARPTAALSRFLQMVGRSLRPQEGKENAVIIDLADNYTRHGFPCDSRKWTLDGVEREPRTDTKLVRNANGEVEEVKIDLRPTNRRVVEIKPIVFSSETLGHWMQVVDEILYQMETENRERKWCWSELVFSSTKPPLLAWQYLGKQLGYHHGWAHHKVDEWVQVQPKKRANSFSSICSLLKSQKLKLKLYSQIQNNRKKHD